MINNKLTKFSIISIGLFFFNLFISCNGQTKSLEDCRSHYKKALTGLNAYYKSSETSYLQESLNNLEQSIKCLETRYKSIDMKISVLILLKRYQRGYEFVDSLSEVDFNAKYKKEMDYDYFRSLEYESKSDTINRNILLEKIINNIQQYIQNENMPKDTFDEDAYFSLFLFKNKLFNSTIVDAEIEILKKKYPNETDYLNGVKTTIDEKPQFSWPLQQQR